MTRWMWDLAILTKNTDGFPLTPGRNDDAGEIPALGAAESLAKYDFLANLFEWSELFAILIWPGTKVPQRGRDRAEVVLGPFPERKGPRHVGAKPHLTLLRVH